MFPDEVPHPPPVTIVDEPTNDRVLVQRRVTFLPGPVLRRRSVAAGFLPLAGPHTALRQDKRVHFIQKGTLHTYCKRYHGRAGAEAPSKEAG